MVICSDTDSDCAGRRHRREWLHTKNSGNKPVGKCISLSLHMSTFVGPDGMATLRFKRINRYWRVQKCCWNDDGRDGLFPIITFAIPWDWHPSDGSALIQFLKSLLGGFWLKSMMSNNTLQMSSAHHKWPVENHIGMRRKLIIIDAYWRWCLNISDGKVKEFPKSVSHHCC